MTMMIYLSAETLSPSVCHPFSTGALNDRDYTVLLHSLKQSASKAAGYKIFMSAPTEECVKLVMAAISDRQ